jgi:hypothetical protein
MVRSDQENTSSFFCSIKHLLCTTHRGKNTLVNLLQWLMDDKLSHKHCIWVLNKHHMF